MRTLVVAVSMVLLLASCATRTGKVAGVVAATSTVVGVATISAPCSDDECATTDAAKGVVFFGITAIALATALIAEARHALTEQPPAPPAQPAPIAEPRPTANPEAVELLVSASIAASAGRCVTVRELGKRLQVLDAALHASAFIVDPAIQRCR